MMKTITLFTIAVAASLATPAAARQTETPPPAKLTKAEAQAIALKAAPGTIVEGEYEKEDGGWRYSFDIRQGKRIHEIGVDANSGKIVESSFEDPVDKD